MKKYLFIFLYFLFTLIFSFEVYALPNTFYLEAQTQLFSQNNKETLNIKSWFSNNKTRVELNNSQNNAIIISNLSKNEAYILNTSDKTGLKIDINKLKNSKNFTSSLLNTNVMKPKEIENEFKKYGAKKVSNEQVLNYACEVWELKPPKIDDQSHLFNNSILKVWFAKELGLILKSELKSGNALLMDFKVNKLKVNTDIPNQLFTVPKDYNLTNLSN